MSQAHPAQFKKSFKLPELYRLPPPGEAMGLAGVWNVNNFPSLRPYLSKAYLISNGLKLAILNVRIQNMYDYHRILQLIINLTDFSKALNKKLLLNAV